jgi:hypothetical protein
MAALAAANNMRYCAKAFKMGAERARVDFFAVDSWEKEFTAQSCALFPADVLLRNSDEIPSNRNKSRDPKPASREDDSAMLEVNIFVDKSGYLA